jgi:heme a synthase
MESNTDNRFFRIAIWCLVLTYLVIIAGAVVRATGSGMGCPDWPKCFGRWVPPTNESQLPSNYQEIYKERGYADTTFNVYHTWTEYVNRLCGATLGFALIILVIRSFKYRKTNSKLMWLSIFILLLTMFQGWLGAKVVSSNLAPYKITTHMLVALVIVFLLIYLLTRIRNGKDVVLIDRSVKITGFILLILILIQVLLGTQVREQVDEINTNMSGMERETWVSQLGIFFYIHRSFSIVLLGFTLFFIVKILRVGRSNLEFKIAAIVLLSLMVLEALTGVILSYFALPGLIQPVHLLLASVIFGYLCFLLLFPGVTSSEKTEEEYQYLPVQNPEQEL